MKIVRIAVTGGPCAGKTTAMDRAKHDYGEQIIVMPEVASILLGHGFPKPGTDVDYSERWLNSFQDSVLTVQRNMENEYLEMALRRMSRLVLFDRGMLDGAAYLGKGLDFFLKHFGLDKEEIYSRYDAVVHLESVSVGNPDLYEKLKASNAARYESAEEAAERDASIKEAWKGHPNWIVIAGDKGIKTVTSGLFDVLSQYLNTEIECKYLLKKMPDIPLGAGALVRQGYISTFSEIRIRQLGERHYITIKSQGGPSRRECERAIDSWAFDELWPDTENCRIEKTRYFIPYDQLTLELDEYHGELEGLVTLECEFRSQEQLENFTLPSWAAGAVDITYDQKYKNRSLALNGRP